MQELPGAGDDGLDRPMVTPTPAPSDDQLIKIAAISSVIGGLATLLIARWFRKHVSVSWRR